MTFSPQSGNVANEFAKYVKTNDKDLIEKFSVDEIKRAMVEFSRDRNKAFYKAMEIRVNDLEGEERLRRTNKEKWKDRFITAFFTIVFIFLPSNFIWKCHIDSSERKNEFAYFYDELNFNRRQLEKTDKILGGFEDYFKKRHDLVIKSWQTGLPLPIPLWGNHYRVEPISKDDPIWNLIKNVTYKPPLRSDVYNRFSEEGFIYELKNDEDLNFLKELYSVFQPKVDTLLDEVFSELKNFPIRSRVTGRKEAAEEIKKKLEKQKVMILRKIQEIRRQINEKVKRLDDIKNGLTDKIGKNL